MALPGGRGIDLLGPSSKLCSLTCFCSILAGGGVKFIYFLGFGGSSRVGGGGGPLRGPEDGGGVTSYLECIWSGSEICLLLLGLGGGGVLFLGGGGGCDFSSGYYW